MKKEEFIQMLEKECKLENIDINNEKLEKLELYKELILTWNQKMNLTAIIDEKEIAIKHFIDCLKITKYINKTDKVIDIGTGAGFPGIVISIFYPELDITLLDSLNKRLIFLEEVKSKLKLDNVKIVHARAEEFAHKEEFREVYDVVVSRAVASLNKLTEFAIGYLKIGGKCVFMKGNNVENEIKESNNTFNILKIKLEDIFKYKLITDEELSRNIIILKKFQVTNKKYPRIFSKIKSNPL